MGSSHSDAESARYIQGSLAVNSLPGMQEAGRKAYSLDTAADIKQVYGRAVTGDFEGNIACELRALRRRFRLGEVRQLNCSSLRRLQRSWRMG